MDYPLISILCLTRNHEAYIRQSLLSDINQDYPNIEIIVLDNKSIDKTSDIARETLETSGKTFHIHRFEENIGIPASLNYALKNLVKGDYVCFNSGDDWMESGNISKKYNYMLLHPEYLWVYSYGYFYFESEKKTERILTRRFHEGYVFEELLKENFIYFHGTLMKKELFEKCGYFDEKVSIEDWDFSLRAVQKYPIGLLREYLFYYRKHKTSYSAMKSKDYYLDCMALLSKYRNNKSGRISYERWHTFYIEHLYENEKSWKSFFYILRNSFFNIYYFRTSLSILKHLLFQSANKNND